MCYTQFRMSQVLDSDNSNLFAKHNEDCITYNDKFLETRQTWVNVSVRIKNDSD